MLAFLNLPLPSTSSENLRNQAKTYRKNTALQVQLLRRFKLDSSRLSNHIHVFSQRTFSRFDLSNPQTATNSKGKPCKSTSPKPRKTEEISKFRLPAIGFRLQGVVCINKNPWKKQMKGKRHKKLTNKG